MTGAGLDGLLVSGGNDLSPALYGGEETHARIDPARDQHELEALELADARQWPVLGICRGSQLLNVAAGGNLHPDINHMRRRTSKRPHLMPRKLVMIERSSQLASITRHVVVRVNSLHHQAVDRLGDGFDVVARDRDGIVQAIERPAGPFRLGVQWHPEYLPCLAAQRRLFRALVDACRRRRDDRR